MSEFTRIDGRKVDELRPITAAVGVLKKADGSALFKLGGTVAVAGVYGPRKVYPKHMEEAERAILRTKYNMAPFATVERGRPGISRRSTEISLVTRQAIMPLLFLDEYPKTAIDVHIELLQAEASSRCVGINAACLALADAGIPMKDMVSSVAVGQVDGTVVADLNYNEESYPAIVSDIPVAMLHNSKEISNLEKQKT